MDCEIKHRSSNISYSLILFGIIGLFFSVIPIDLDIQNTNMGHLVIIIEVIFNSIIILGGAIFFLVTRDSIS